MFDVIIYHDRCPDGSTGAVIARRHCPEAQLYPIRPSQDVAFSHKNILYVDVSPTLKNLRELLKTGNTITILDHHASAVEELKMQFEYAEYLEYNIKDHDEGSAHGSAHVILDMNRSGAGLAWDFFCPGEARPLFVQYIEDHDLWRFHLPNSRTLRGAFQDVSYKDLDQVERLIHTFPDAYQDWVRKGEGILRNLSTVVFPDLLHETGYDTIFRDAPTKVSKMCDVAYISDYGDWLLRFTGYNFVVLYQHMKTENGEMTKVSLRGDGTYNLSELAREYGGGGHHNASGFRILREEFERLFRSFAMT